MDVGSPARLPLHVERPVAALGLAVGPAAFIAAWAVGGALTEGYSPITDAISRIAAVGAPRRTIMDAGFVAFSGAMAVGALGLEGSTLHRLWPIALVNAVATLGVAATPLDRSATVDAWHGIAATTGYAALAAMPLAAAAPLRASGRRGAASASVVVGLGVAASLAITPFTDANGLFQRLGLTLGDLWLIAAGVALFRSGGRSPVAGDESGPPATSAR